MCVVNHSLICVLYTYLKPPSSVQYESKRYRGSKMEILFNHLYPFIVFLWITRIPYELNIALGWLGQQ